MRSNGSPFSGASGGEIASIARGELGYQPALTVVAGCRLANEAERARLIGDLSLLMRDTSIPQTARVAGLTLIGWLARRRLEESPHAIGVDEARESEQRIRATRTKTR